MNLVRTVGGGDLVRHYITVYGFWWSMSPEAWLALAERMVAGGHYDLDKDARPLRARPNTVRVEGNPSTGRKYYHDVAGHPVHRILDWTDADWEEAVREAKDNP